jgi:hypothetical protein
LAQAGGSFAARRVAAPPDAGTTASSAENRSYEFASRVERSKASGASPGEKTGENSRTFGSLAPGSGLASPPCRSLSDTV